MEEKQSLVLNNIGKFLHKSGYQKLCGTFVGYFGLDSRNSREYQLVQFAEIDNLRILNTFFKKRTGRKWIWRSPNRETKNVTNFILTVIVMDVAFLNK